MAQLMTALIIELIVISPLIWVALHRDGHKWRYLALFALYYIGYSCLLFAPLVYPSLLFVDSEWNWSGKIYGILGSILFLILFRKEFGEHNFITLRQRSTSSKPILIVTIIAFVAAVVLAVLSVMKSGERFEYYFFQFTMPGLDEELAFRGIMLGLLSNTLKPRINIRNISLGNPALIITSILFGLGHSFQIDPDWCFHQNWVEFISTFATGLLLGWLTLRSGSILMAILIHDLFNVIPLLIVSGR